jgi:hypothetical protein
LCSHRIIHIGWPIFHENSSKASLEGQINTIKVQVWGYQIFTLGKRRRYVFDNILIFVVTNLIGVHLHAKQRHYVQKQEQ